MEFRPSRTQDAFIRCRATVVALIGPQGEGKTWAGAIALWHRAQEWKSRTGLPMPGAIIRDSHTNLKRMTVPSIEKAFRHEKVGALIKWKDDYHKLLSLDGCLDIDLFGLDDLGALTRIQGAEYAFIWMEEPAPMIEVGNAGISLDVFDACLSRVARGISTHFANLGLTPRLQITMNPADEDHWSFQELVHSPRIPSLQYPDLSLQVVNIPYGENPHQSDISRQATKAAFAQNTGLYMRYVEGRFAFVQVGERVTPEYAAHIHRASVDIQPIPGAQGFRFWDGGLNPTCLMGQITPNGRLVFMDSFVGQNMGMRQLIRSYVQPVLAAKYGMVLHWRDIGDPSLANRDQSDSDQSAAQVLEAQLGAHFEPGPQSWDVRREAAKEALSRLVDGGPMVLLSRSEGYLHRALRGGWHYRKDPAGRVLTDAPIKDMHSHPGDAFGYGCAVLLGRSGELKQPGYRRRRLAQAQAFDNYEYA